MLDKINSKSILGLSIALIAVPVLAGEANFGQLLLARGFNQTGAVVNGYTSGSYSLSSIANTDKNNNPCIGYSDPTPDHIIVLEQDFPRLTLRVDSAGKDTTLVVRGPDNTIRCDFASSDDPDARVEDTNWKSGQYEVWVGSIEPGQRWNYRLYAQE